jgi:hypothetical protein
MPRLNDELLEALKNLVATARAYPYGCGKCGGNQISIDMWGNESPCECTVLLRAVRAVEDAGGLNC